MERVSSQGETGIIIGLVTGGCVILVVIGVCIAVLKCKKFEKSKPTKESAVAIEMGHTRNKTFIPENWVRHVTDEGQAYYEKPDGTTQWERPDVPENSIYF